MLHAINRFIKLESSGGILLVIFAILALILANSPLSSYYTYFFQAVFTISFDGVGLSKPLVLWINDGLMAIFFLLVGLEIKREFLEGELNTKEKALLPGIAAFGGMAAPALVYAVLNWGDSIAMRGWAIPTATDIAFALGVLSLLGKRVPSSLKVFLTALAILDDLGAILIIALFYTSDLSLLSIGLATLCLAILILFNHIGIVRFTPYALVGAVMWVCVLKSGVHATLAGVAIAWTYPLRDKRKVGHSPGKVLEDTLHPWVAFLILPLFAFANAGVPFAGMTLKTLIEPIPLGIILGLFLGKQIGIFGASWVAVKLGLTRLPESSNWRAIYGVSLLCGIGFTMSLFIGSLAFAGFGDYYSAILRLGVLVGSVLSGVLGYLILASGSKVNTA